MILKFINKIINLGKIHPLTCIQSPNLSSIKIGNNSFISAFSTVITAKNKSNPSPIILGDNVSVKSRGYILSWQGVVKINNGTQIGTGVTILGGGGVDIGKNVQIGPNVVIASSYHDKIDGGARKVKFAPIHIKDNVFIGANATILSGCTIAEGVTIGAGAVVTKNIEEPHAVVAGVPAKKLENNTNLMTSLEKEIESFLRHVPFHNLFYLYDIPLAPSAYGGTCSDRTKYFKALIDQKYKDSGIVTLFHRAYIRGNDTHTLLKIKINDKFYFADVGMGFPFMKMIPSDIDCSFTALGIWFHSSIHENQIVVRSNIQSQEMTELMRFNVDSDYSQSEILDKMEKRFEKKEQLPFHQGLRYMFIHENTFYMIKHDDPFFQRETTSKYVTKYLSNEQ